MKQFSQSAVRAYDLEERTMRFSESIIALCKSIQINGINRSIISQLIRSCTSIGANYCEANAASSKKDFRNKIYICKKEACEARYWIRLLANTNPEAKNSLRALWQEVYQFVLIFNRITSSLKPQHKNWKFNRNLKLKIKN